MHNVHQFSKLLFCFKELPTMADGCIIIYQLVAERKPITKSLKKLETQQKYYMHNDTIMST